MSLKDEAEVLTLHQVLKLVFQLLTQPRVAGFGSCHKVGKSRQGLLFPKVSLGQLFSLRPEDGGCRTTREVKRGGLIFP